MEIIAHRGLWYPGGPEQNTMAAFDAAYAAECRLIELDVHLTASGTPVVVHDWTFCRGGDTVAIGETDFVPATIPTLAEVAKWAAPRDVMLFVELKTESLELFGRDFVRRQVRDALRPVYDRYVPISFDREAIASGWGDSAVGWVVRDMAAQTLENSGFADFLIIDKRKITGALPQQWSWVVYTVDDPSEVAALQSAGARYIETNRCDRVKAC